MTMLRKQVAGLADLAGMCGDRNDFKDMMKVVVGLPSLVMVSPIYLLYWGGLLGPTNQKITKHH